jgi:hypothetical protein
MFVCSLSFLIPIHVSEQMRSLGTTHQIEPTILPVGGPQVLRKAVHTTPFTPSAPHYSSIGLLASAPARPLSNRCLPTRTDSRRLAACLALPRLALPCVCLCRFAFRCVSPSVDCSLIHTDPAWVEQPASSLDCYYPIVPRAYRRVLVHLHAYSAYMVCPSPMPTNTH